MDKERKITIRLTGELRQALEREAEAAGISLSEQVRRLLLATHPHVSALEDVARIHAVARQSGARGSEGLPYLENMRRRLEEGLRALQGLEAMTRQWREAAADELQAALADINEHIRLLAGLDQIATTMKKGLERGGDVHAGSRERNPDRVD